MHTTNPATNAPTADEDFDIVKVNRLRSLVRQGRYSVDVVDVAEQLLTEHLLFSTLFDPLFMDTEFMDTEFMDSEPSRL